MPCFHFDVRGEELTRSGMDLSGVEQARIEAVRLAGALLIDTPETFWNGAEWALDVRNCDREVLFTLAMSCRDGPAGVRPNDACPDTP